MALAVQCETHVDATPKWREVTARPPGYLDVPEATRRAMNSAEWNGKKNREAVRREVYRLAEEARESAVPPVMQNERLYLPPSLHPAFQSRDTAGDGAAGLESLPAARRNRATAKLSAIHDFEQFKRSPEGAALRKDEAQLAFCKRNADRYSFSIGFGERRSLPLSPRSLERWGQLHRDGGLEALARDGRGGFDREGQSQEAIDLYWAIRNDPRKFTSASAWRRVRLEADKHGWKWFRSRVTCRVWDARERDERALILNREGDGAWTAKAAPYMEADPESFEPGECWESDHSTINVWCKTRTGKIVRPVLTHIQDWRSRAGVGSRIVIVGNSESILAAFRDGARAHGLPAVFVMDNGKDFSSFIWTGGKPKRQRQKVAADFVERTEGIFARMDVKPRWVMPYSPNSKARIERFFGTFDDQFCKSFPSYCGNCPDNRPDAHAALIEKAVDFDEFIKRFRDWLAVYNSTPHSGDGMNQMTPSQVLSLATTKRVLTVAQATELLAAWPRPVRIHRNGVSIRIAGETLNYGAFDQALQRLAIGTQVRVNYDPDDLSSVGVWSMDGKFIATAEENHRFNRSFTTEQHRETLRDRRRIRRIHRESRRAGISHLADPVAQTIAANARDAAARRLPDPAATDSGPTLKPVQTDIDVGSKTRRKVAQRPAAPDAISDAEQRLRAFTDRCRQERKEKSDRPSVDPLLTWSRREAAHA